MGYPRIWLKKTISALFLAALCYSMLRFSSSNYVVHIHTAALTLDVIALRSSVLGYVDEL